MREGKNTVIATIAIICFLLSMIIFMQFKVTYEMEQTNIDSLEETELRASLADWKEKYDEVNEKYKEEYDLLKSYKEEATNDVATRKNLEDELAMLNLVLGNTNVEGEGIIIKMEEMSEDEINSNDFLSVSAINAEILINIVNTLKDAGAEAISINGERIVNTTDISDIEFTGNSILTKINGKFMRESGYEIRAIGNSSYLQSSIDGKGGLASVLQATGINIIIEKQNKVEIKAYTGERKTNYLKEEESDQK